MRHNRAAALVAVMLAGIASTPNTLVDAAASSCSKGVACTAGTWSQQSVVNGELFCCNGGAMSTATSSSSNANNGGTLTTCSCSSDGGDACMGIYCDACGIGMEEDPTRGCWGRSSIDVSIDTGASSSSFAAMPPPTAAAVAVVVAVGVAAAANML
eukprot:gene19073-14165_t